MPWKTTLKCVHHVLDLHINGFLCTSQQRKREEEKGVVKIMEEVRRAILQGHPEIPGALGGNGSTVLSTES